VQKDRQGACQPGKLDLRFAMVCVTVEFYEQNMAIEMGSRVLTQLTIAVKLLQTGCTRLGQASPIVSNQGWTAIRHLSANPGVNSIKRFGDTGCQAEGMPIASKSLRKGTSNQNSRDSKTSSLKL
jgi:hypothetical protein